jgi:Lrp/AsnC family leucine-responsive transcriptional regulator
MRNVNQKSRLDDIDINLLDRLQTDARITNVALAEAVNLSPAPLPEKGSRS